LRVYLTSTRDFFKTRRRQKDLNQAEDFPPLGLPPPSRPAIAETTRQGNRKEISMNPLIQLKTATPLFLIVLACLMLSPRVQAVSPAPDGGYPSSNTAEGDNALLSLTTGGSNTAVGWSSLKSNTTAANNTAIGAGALLVNNGGANTATGAGALFRNTAGENNTANGLAVLYHNTTGGGNTATGFSALISNMTGNSNTAYGLAALDTNTSGSFNIALGVEAGTSVTTANSVICIGADGANVSNSCYIGQIFGKTSSGGAAVLINSDGKLGTVPSSRRFKDNIKPMDKASEAILELKPVTFRYKKEIDPAGTSQFGLVAEEVEKVNADLVVRDKEGKPYSVRYDQVNAMLLNEFLKEHRAFLNEQRKVEVQEKTIAELKSGMTALAATVKEQASQIQKVSAQLEASKPAPQVVNNP
jgi:hypothetical protein